jgi:hypothetical protein
MTFPTEPTTSVSDCDGVQIHQLLTPPIMARKAAFRIRATKRVDRRGTVRQADWCLEVGPGWSGQSKSRWAAAAHRDPLHFRSDHNRSMPETLHEKWMEAVFKFLYEHDQELLTVKLDTIAARKLRKAQAEQVKRDAQKAFQDKYGKLEHGDLGIVKRPMHFRSGSLVTQYFIMLKSLTHGRRLTPCIYVEGPPEAFLPITGSPAFASQIMKIGPEAFKSAPNISAHNQIRLLGLAEDMKRRCEGGRSPIICT